MFITGDSIILNCQADGTPTPEILWYKDANPVEPSATVGIFNDGTELRISTIRHDDIGDYTCIARNGEGQVSHTARVIIAGGAVIMVNKNEKRKTKQHIPLINFLQSIKYLTNHIHTCNLLVKRKKRSQKQKCSLGNLIKSFNNCQIYFHYNFH